VCVWGGAGASKSFVLHVVDLANSTLHVITFQAARGWPGGGAPHPVTVLHVVNLASTTQHVIEFDTICSV
jgi:hypothetical protein